MIVREDHIVCFCKSPTLAGSSDRVLAVMTPALALSYCYSHVSLGALGLPYCLPPLLLVLAFCLDRRLMWQPRVSSPRHCQVCGRKMLSCSYFLSTSFVNEKSWRAVAGGAVLAGSSGVNFFFFFFISVVTVSSLELFSFSFFPSFY